MDLLFEGAVELLEGGGGIQQVSAHQLLGADQRLELTDRALYPHRGLQIHVADAAALPDQGS